MVEGEVPILRRDGRVSSGSAYAQSFDGCPGMLVGLHLFLQGGRFRCREHCILFLVKCVHV